MRRCFDAFALVGCSHVWCTNPTRAWEQLLASPSVPLLPLVFKESTSELSAKGRQFGFFFFLTFSLASRHGGGVHAGQEVDYSLAGPLRRASRNSM